MHTLLSRASAHTCQAPTPVQAPILPPSNMDFLRSSVQPPTILNSCVVNLNVAPLSSHSCDCSDALWAPWHQASKVCTHPSMASFAAFFPCSMKFMYCKWWLNVAETWQRGYKSVHFAAQIQLSPLSGWPRWSTDEVTMRYTLEASNFVSGVDLCMEIIESFKQLLCATAHPQFLAPELRAAVGACLGQYGKCHS